MWGDWGAAPGPRGALQSGGDEGGAANLRRLSYAEIERRGCDAQAQPG